MKMLAKPEDLADCVKQAGEIRARVIKTLHGVIALLDPATPEVFGEEPVKPMRKLGEAAHDLQSAFTGVAALVVGQRSQTALELALAGPATIEAVRANLDEFLVFNACMPDVHGPFLAVYEKEVVRQAGESLHEIDRQLAAFANEVDVAAKAGIDFDAVLAGDLEARTKLGIAVMKNILTKVPPGLSLEVTAPGSTATQVAAQFDVPSHQVEEVGPGVFHVSAAPLPDQDHEADAASFTPRPRSPDLEDDGIRA